jgi:hypothetical protein
MPDFEVDTETETGIVYRSSSVAVFVHKSIDDTLAAAQQAARMHTETPDGAVRIEPLDNEPRSHADRGALLAVLTDEVSHFEFQHTDVTRDSPESARIPVQVAAAGKAAIACYAAIHGLTNGEIADLLGVGNRTVSQYISDFRKGER